VVKNKEVFDEKLFNMQTAQFRKPPELICTFKHETEEEFRERLKNSDTLAGASMRLRLALNDLVKAAGIEKLLTYCIKKIARIIGG